MWTTAECYAPNATADAATAGTVKEEHATTRKTRTNETDYPSPSCQHNAPTHGEHAPPFQNTERRRGKETGSRTEQKKRRQDNRETQWCSGITCVLAGLRAHYPEHQHTKEEKGRERKRRKRKKEGTSKRPCPSTHRLSAHHNHHRHSTMTPPCHKDTTLNQQ